MSNELKNLELISDEHLIGVAKLVDNGFIGKNKTTVTRKRGEPNLYTVNTNECDDVSIIRIYISKNELRRIMRDHEDSNEITLPTAIRVFKYLSQFYHIHSVLPPQFQATAATVRVKPLSEIEDDDAIEVAKIIYPDTSLWKVKKTEYSISIWTMGYCVDIILKNTFDIVAASTGEYDHVSTEDIITIINYLQGKGYSIPSAYPTPTHVGGEVDWQSASEQIRGVVISETMPVAAKLGAIENIYRQHLPAALPDVSEAVREIDWESIAEILVASYFSSNSTQETFKTTFKDLNEYTQRKFRDMAQAIASLPNGDKWVRDNNENNG